MILTIQIWPYGGRMAILVDEARWPWRDTYWCHLVSDTDLVELHDFARQLGCRRVGFQGDHYDIDIVSREQAIEIGAEAVGSRELVRRLKAAGLRLRPSQFAKWELSSRGPASELPASQRSPELVPFLDQAEGYFALHRKRSDGTATRATVVFGHGPVDLPTESGDTGLFARIDRDGGWAVEVLDPPPTPQE